MNFVLINQFLSGIYLFYYIYSVWIDTFLSALKFQYCSVLLLRHGWTSRYNNSTGTIIQPAMSIISLTLRNATQEFFIFVANIDQSTILWPNYAGQMAAFWRLWQWRVLCLGTYKFVDVVNCICARFSRGLQTVW